MKAVKPPVSSWIRWASRSFRARPSSERPRAPRTLSAVPELPEVETIRRQLAPLVEGRVVGLAHGHVATDGVAWLEDDGIFFTIHAHAPLGGRGSLSFVR